MFYWNSDFIYVNSHYLIKSSYRCCILLLHLSIFCYGLKIRLKIIVMNLDRPKVCYELTGKMCI